MGFFEQYGWFVNFGQFTGFIPYRMQSDPSSSCKKFVFSWCHPLTWWFTLSFAMKMISLVATILMFQFVEEFSRIILTLPKAIIALLCIANVTHYAMLIISHGTMLRCRKLRSAVASITAKPIKELEDRITDFPTYINTLKKRTLIGIFLILTSVNKFRNKLCFQSYFIQFNSLSTINVDDSKFHPSVLVPILVFDRLY